MRSLIFLYFLEFVSNFRKKYSLYVAEKNPGINKFQLSTIQSCNSSV